jgi:hypothetical protein
MKPTTAVGAAGLWTAGLTVFALALLVAQEDLTAAALLVGLSALWAGILLIRYPENGKARALAVLLLTLAIVPLLVGGFGFLFLPVVVVAIVDRPIADTGSRAGAVMGGDRKDARP